MCLQSPAFEYVLAPVLKIEGKDIVEGKRLLEIELAEKGGNTVEEGARKKAKLENGNTTGFKKDAYQKVLINGTYSGLEDVLAAKFKKGVTTAVLFGMDELSCLLNALEKDPNFDSNFLMLYTAKVSLIV